MDDIVMEKRDIIDWQGNVIGELSFPEGTSEDAWQNALSPYLVPPEDQVARAWEILRAQRLALIVETKWIRSRHEEQKTLGIQTTLSEEQYLEWLAYWQALRDLPENTTNPFLVDWPEQPV